MAAVVVTHQTVLLTLELQTLVVAVVAALKVMVVPLVVLVLL